MKYSNMWLPRLRYHQNDNLLKCHVTTDCHDMCIAMDACIRRERKRINARERGARIKEDGERVREKEAERSTTDAIERERERWEEGTEYC